MIKEIDQDIFLAPIDILCHQANCFHTMGSGIARHIRERFPEAYDADVCKTKKGDLTKMGTYSFAKVISPNPNKRLKTIVNMYSQGDFGRKSRFTDYEAVAECFEKLREQLISYNHADLVVGVPWKYGCNIAGGDWNVVKAILTSIFENSPLTLLICKHPDAEGLNQRILGTPSVK
jgi:O-acetyl-ADP-ribose deacetylase (regulator of RNase III)